MLSPVLTLAMVEMRASTDISPAFHANFTGHDQNTDYKENLSGFKNKVV